MSFLLLDERAREPAVKTYLYLDERVCMWSTPFHPYRRRTNACRSLPTHHVHTRTHTGTYVLGQHIFASALGRIEVR